MLTQTGDILNGSSSLKDSTGGQKFVLSLRKFTRLIMFLMKNNSMKLRGKTFYFF